MVRRADAIDQIQQGPSIQQFPKDRIQYAVVPDNTVPHAYDEAIAGASYVVHIAGVWPMPVSRPASFSPCLSCRRRS